MIRFEWLILDALLFCLCVAQVATAKTANECVLFAAMALGFGLLGLHEWKLIK